jgi:hypothetical protein
MQHIQFRTEQAVNNFLKEYIDQIQGIEEANRSLLMGDIKEEIKEMERPNTKDGTLGFMIAKYRYVIKNEDLPILESLFDGLKVAAGADFFVVVSTGDINKTWAGAIGIFSTLFKLYKNIKNKGKVLPALDFQILLCLKNHPEGLEIGYFQFLLEQNGIILSKDELQQSLEGLSKVYMHDGSKKELVIIEGDLYKAKGI